MTYLSVIIPIRLGIRFDPILKLGTDLKISRRIGVAADALSPTLE